MKRQLYETEHVYVQHATALMTVAIMKKLTDVTLTPSEVEIFTDSQRILESAYRQIVESNPFELDDKQLEQVKRSIEFRLFSLMKTMFLDRLVSQSSYLFFKDEVNALLDAYEKLT